MNPNMLRNSIRDDLPKIKTLTEKLETINHIFRDDEVCYKVQKIEIDPIFWKVSISFLEKVPRKFLEELVKFDYEIDFNQNNGGNRIVTI